MNLLLIIYLHHIFRLYCSQLRHPHQILRQPQPILRLLHRQRQLERILQLLVRLLIHLRYLLQLHRHHLQMYQLNHQLDTLSQLQLHRHHLLHQLDPRLKLSSVEEAILKANLALKDLRLPPSSLRNMRCVVAVIALISPVHGLGRKSAPTSAPTFLRSQRLVAFVKQEPFRRHLTFAVMLVRGFVHLTRWKIVAQKALGVNLINT